MPYPTRVHSAPRMSRSLSFGSTSSTSSSSLSSSSEDSDLYAGDWIHEDSITYPEPRQTQAIPLNRMPLLDQGRSAEVPERADFRQSRRALLPSHRETRKKWHPRQVFGASEPSLAEIIGNQSLFYRTIAQAERQNTGYIFSIDDLKIHLHGMDLAMSKALEQDPEAVAGFRFCSSIIEELFESYFTQFAEIMILHKWCKDLEKKRWKFERRIEKMRKMLRREDRKVEEKEFWDVLEKITNLVLKFL